MRNRLFAPLLISALLFTPIATFAQATPGRSGVARGQGQAPPRLITQMEAPAEEVRQELRDLLERYPPSLGRVLKLDPSLMLSENYLAPYPALAEFLARNPQVPNNASYFLNFVSIDSSSPFSRADSPEVSLRRDAINMWRSTIGDVMAFMVFLVVTAAIIWLVRYLIAHRRWLRATKMQSEVHGRLLERFSSNDELLAYVQSPAGSQFLKAAPIPVEPAGSPVGAPLNRILWSVQAGLVLASAGIGCLIIKQHVIEEVAQLLLTLGVLGISVGIGFALAAGASYMLSARLGLLEQTK
jgi:hypothetical protein